MATRKKKTLNAKKAMTEAKAARAKKAEESTLLMPTTKAVQDLAAIKRRTKKRTAEITGELGSAVAKAAESKHLDKTAFSIATRLDALSDDKLAVTLPHLRRYIDDLELDKRATAQGVMFEAEDDAENDGKDEQRTTPALVAGRDVEETAGAAAS